MSPTAKIIIRKDSFIQLFSLTVNVVSIGKESFFITKVY